MKKAKITIKSPQLLANKISNMMIIKSNEEIKRLNKQQVLHVSCIKQKNSMCTYIEWHHENSFKMTFLSTKGNV